MTRDECAAIGGKCQAEDMGIFGIAAQREDALPALNRTDLDLGGNAGAAFNRCADRGGNMVAVR